MRTAGCKSSATRCGPAHARNLGARLATGDLLLFVDADITIPVDTLQQIRAAFTAEPELTALFGSYDTTPGATNFLSQYKNLLHHYMHQTAREDASTFWAGCGAIRRAAFLALGGFNERYRQPSVEDIDLGVRLRQAGYRIRLCKTLQVTHEKRWTIWSLVSTDVLLRGLPWTELLLRTRFMPNDLNVGWPSRLSIVLVYLLVVAIPSSRWWSLGVLVSGVTLLLLVLVNLPVYRFFWRQRGLGFAVATIPWHWLYY